MKHAPTTSFLKTNLPVDTRHKVTYIHDMYFSHICHFRPMTQPNPLKNTNFRPIPDPTQPNPRVNPTHGQLCAKSCSLAFVWPTVCAFSIVFMQLSNLCCREKLFCVAEQLFPYRRRPVFLGSLTTDGEALILFAIIIVWSSLSLLFYRRKCYIFIGWNRVTWPETGTSVSGQTEWSVDPWIAAPYVHGYFYIHWFLLCKLIKSAA